MEPASPDLRQRLRTASRRLGLTAFWQWWAGELAPLIPYRLRNAVARKRLRPVLAFDTDAVVLWVPEVANHHLAYRESTRIPLSAGEPAAANAGRAAIDALSAAADGPRASRTRVVVALPASQVLRKTITLPAAVEDNLAQVLSYDLDRHTPFKPDEVCFDANIVARDPIKKEVRVDWVAALKTVVDQSLRRAESWGAVVVAVTPDRPAGGAVATGTSLNLLPGAERPGASSRPRWEIWIPIALTVAAALVATALPVWQKRGYAIALLQLAAQGRVQADASNALREQLERLTGDYNFALSKKYAFPSALQSVDDVTKLLPDDTWLTQFEMKSTVKGKEPRREIVVRGESVNAGRLISLFEESKLFGEAAPRSPTTKIQPGPGEIFDLGAQLKPLPPPPPIQLATTATPATAVAPAPPATIRGPGNAGSPTATEATPSAKPAAPAGGAAPAPGETPPAPATAPATVPAAAPAAAPGPAATKGAP